MILVAGTGGAHPESLVRGLAEALGEPVQLVGENDSELVENDRGPGHAAAVSSPAVPHAAILAVDLSAAAGSAEAELLELLQTCGAPVALAGMGAGAAADWPQRLAAARERLDPGHRWPVFALAAEPAVAGGLAAVARWCAAPGPERTEQPPPDQPPPDPPGAGSGPVEPPNPGSPGTEHPAEAQASARFPVRRAERLAGARAGFAELRGQLSGLLRTGARQLDTSAASSCARLSEADVPAFETWLQAALADYLRRISRELADGTGQVRAAALAGTDAPPEAPAPAAAIAVPAHHGEPRSRRPSAEDLVLLALGASAGLGLGRVTVGPLVSWAGMGTLGTVITVLAGLVVAGAVVTVRRRGARRIALRRAAGEAIAATRTAAEHVVAVRVSAAEAQLSRELWNLPRVVEPTGDLVRQTF